MADDFVEGCYHLSVAASALKGGMSDCGTAAAHASIATAYFAKGRWEAAAEEATRPSEPVHHDGKIFFHCGCTLTVPARYEGDVDLYAPHCPLHDPNTRIPRELIEHWQTTHEPEPF